MRSVLVSVVSDMPSASIERAMFRCNSTLLSESIVRITVSCHMVVAKRKKWCPPPEDDWREPVDALKSAMLWAPDPLNLLDESATVVSSSVKESTKIRSVNAASMDRSSVSPLRYSGLTFLTSASLNSIPKIAQHCRTLRT